MVRIPANAIASCFIAIALIGSWFMNFGLLLVTKGYKQLSGNAIRHLASPIVESVPKHAKRISHDRLNFFRFPEDELENGKFAPEYLENEVLEIMAATVKGDLCSSSYPKIRPTEANLRNYGIKSDNSVIAFIQASLSTFRDTVKAADSGNMNDAAITKKWARLTANQIARKHEYNKGKISVKDSERKYYNVSTGNFITGVEYKALKEQEKKYYKSAPAVSDDNYYHLSTKKKPDIQEVPDSTPADIDRMEHQELYRQAMAIYTHMEPADQLILQTNKVSVTQELSWEAAYLQLEPEYRKAGITTCRGAKKRRDTLLKRHFELQQIKDALKK